MPVFWHNWKTSVLGIVAFLSYLATQQSTIMTLLPAVFLPQAHAIFAVSILLLGFFVKDAGSKAALPVALDAPKQ